MAHSSRWYIALAGGTVTLSSMPCKCRANVNILQALLMLARWFLSLFLFRSICTSIFFSSILSVVPDTSTPAASSTESATPAFFRLRRPFLCFFFLFLDIWRVPSLIFSSFGGVDSPSARITCWVQRRSFTDTFFSSYRRIYWVSGRYLRM